MKLEAYIRNKTSQYLRDLIIKDKCEVCDSSDNMELHHIEAFAIIMNECFEDLGYDRHDDTEEYTDIELKNITYWMLGAQLQSTYSTLCQSCHIDWHSEQGGFYKTTNKFYEYYRKKEIKDKLKEKERCDNVIKPYLENLVGVRLFKDDKQQVIDIINYRVNGRQQKSHTKLNYALDEVLKLPYVITSKKSGSTRYWIVEKY